MGLKINGQAPANPTLLDHGIVVGMDLSTKPDQTGVLQLEKFASPQVLSEIEALMAAGQPALYAKFGKKFDPTTPSPTAVDGADEALEYLLKSTMNANPELLHSITPPGYGQVVQAVVQSIAADPLTESIKKALPKSKTHLTESDSLVSELIDLERRLIDLEVADMLKRKDELRKAILKDYAEFDPDKTLVLNTEDGQVEFSACSKEFKIGDKSKLASALGEEAFFELAKFGITDLKKVMSENELLTVGEYVPGSSRTMKIKVNK